MTAPGVFYPPDATTAEDRLRYYADQFPIVEVDATYYALPNRHMGEVWLERTPPDFTFDIKAHALMTGQPSEVKRLPKELREGLPLELLDGKRVYGRDLPPQFWFLWLGTVVNRLGGFAVPFLMLYLTGRLGIGPAEAALMVSVLGAGSFCSQLTGGELADRLGRRPVMLLSFFIAPVAMLTLGIARETWLLVAAMFALGFFMDLYRPAVSAAVVDLVYRAGETPWVRGARARGHHAQDGLAMLVEQGALAFERWTGRPAPLTAMRRGLGL